MKPRGSLRSDVFPLRSVLLLLPHQVDEPGWQMPQPRTLQRTGSNSAASQKAPTLLPHCPQDAPSARVIFQD